MPNTDINFKIEQLAIKLYGLHRSYIPLGFSSTVNHALELKMQVYAKKLQELGATMETNNDGISRYPKIQNLDGEILPYDIGRLECEKINSLICENFDEFIKLY